MKAARKVSLASSLTAAALILLLPFLLFLALGRGAPVDRETARAAEAPRTLKVGWVVEDGMSDYDAAKEMYGGYNYDYLGEITYYTGLKFEYVLIRGSGGAAKTEAVEKLRDGRIDVMCNAFGSEGDFFYSSSYGAVSQSLVVDAAGSVSAAQLIADEPVIAVETGQDVSALDDILTGSYSLLEANSREESLSALRSSGEGRADAALVTDMEKLSGVRRELTFSPRAFYFAARDGEAAAALSRGLDKIAASQPEFSHKLKDKYFSVLPRLSLSDEEKNYIAGRREVKVVSPEKAPIAFYNADGSLGGIARDVLTYVSSGTGLKFTFVRDEADDLPGLLSGGGADLLAAVPRTQAIAEKYGVAASVEYLSCNMALIANKKVNSQNLNDKKLVLSRGMSVPADVTNVKFVKTLENCLSLVDVGTADYTYGNSYCVQYLLSRRSFNNLAVVGQTSQSQEICFGVSGGDSMLLGILNKAIGSISDSQMADIVFRNLNKLEEKKFDFFNSVAFGITASAVGVLIIVVLIVLYILKLRYDRAIDDNRWKQLCSLDDRLLYYYDYGRDLLRLSKPLSSSFGKPEVIKRFSKLAEKEGTPDFVRIMTDFRSRRGGVAELKTKGYDDSTRYLLITEKAFENARGKVVGAVGKVEDVTEDKMYNINRQTGKERDSLTDLLNSATLKEKVQTAIAEGVRGAVFLLMDIDNFKEINERGGALEGDRVLINAARIIEKTLDGEDALIGRLGGDEFIVYIKSGVTRQRLTEMLSALRYNVRSIAVTAKDIGVTLSIGCVVPRPGMSFNELYDRADKALLEAKAAGRNTYEIAGGVTND